MTKWYASQVHKNGSTYTNYNVIYHIKKERRRKKKKKKHLIISIGKKKLKNSIPTHDKKTLTKVGIERTYIIIIKSIYNKPTTNIILNDKKMKVLLL